VAVRMAGTTPVVGPTGSRVVLAELRDSELSVAEVVAAVTGPTTGGTAVFVGTVRDNDADPAGARAVTGLDYSAHPDAEQVLARVAAEVGASVAAEVGAAAGGSESVAVTLAVVHRTGSLPVGGIAIVAAAGAAHRGLAFTACHRLVDEVKVRVPIWKREHHVDGSAHWVGMPQTGDDPSCR